ncbi:uncharacterized protein LOC134689684 [Mytilus trossulus]|uniref:uncharacterized protein LOC134689684 n=1 Tax=Mytilus trossulus TaxID=6551 RepID=UPI003003AEF6
MAQVLSVSGNVRLGFAFKTSFHHDFGRITGIAASTRGNILLCDYDNKKLILVNPFGKYLNKLSLESEPYDVAITSQNIGHITQPNTRYVLQIDPDRLVVLYKATSNDMHISVNCASAVPNSGLDIPNKVSCYLGVTVNGSLCLTQETHISSNGYAIDHRVMKFHAVDVGTFLYCIGDQNYIKFTKSSSLGYHCKEHIVNIETMVMPTDICSDNNGHIYVIGQGSNNIHRLTNDGKVIDIPLDCRHGIKQPVALSLNQDYVKLYVVNEWGKSVLVFDVI